jgi:hypothetical protein
LEKEKIELDLGLGLVRVLGSALPRVLVKGLLLELVRVKRRELV